MDEAKVRALVGKLRKSADKYEEMAQQEKLDLLSKKWLEGGAVCRMEDADMLEDTGIFHLIFFSAPPPFSRILKRQNRCEIDWILAAGPFKAAANQPCGFQRDAELAGELCRRPMPCGQQLDGLQPFFERHMRPGEDSSGANREIKPAGIAAIVAVFSDGDALAAAAARASDALRPAHCLKIFARRHCSACQARRRSWWGRCGWGR